MACKNIPIGLHIFKIGCGTKVLGSPTAIISRNYSNTRNDVEETIHTGQVFDKDDYRNARFVNARRYVNENWGIKLIDEVPPIEVKDRVVYCDGGDAHLGHPKIYINLDKPGPQACGYCGLRFVKKDGHH